MSIEELGLELGMTLETHGGFKSKMEDLARSEVQRLEREEETLNTMLQGVRSELKAARGILTLIHPPEPKPKQTQAKVYPKTVSQERREQLVAWLTGLEDEFTVGEVVTATGWSESAASATLNIFREEGLVRIARMGGKTGSLRFYRSLV